MFHLQEWRAQTISSLSTSACVDIDALGMASGEAQFLKGPITTIEKLREAPDHVLITVNQYLEIDEAGEEGGKNTGRILGYLKYGLKNLYFYRKNGQVEERMSVSLLDFYVSEAFQRNGLGLMLFEHFLTLTNTSHPCKVAYDRPSPKLLSFLSKHFSLTNPDAQPNRYTIYEGFL